MPAFLPTVELTDTVVAALRSGDLYLCRGQWVSMNGAKGRFLSASESGLSICWRFRAESFDGFNLRFRASCSPRRPCRSCACSRPSQLCLPLNGSGDSPVRVDALVSVWDGGFALPHVVVRDLRRGRRVFGVAGDVTRRFGIPRRALDACRTGAVWNYRE